MCRTLTFLTEIKCTVTDLNKWTNIILPVYKGTARLTSPLHPQDSLPYMAQEYGFQYELVQYQWPRWLQRQRDRQRTIWGYKILFLDVLFPLHVKKIIFVDADQVLSLRSVTLRPKVVR